MFIGLSVLLSSSHEARLQCVFEMLDANGTGRISRAEVPTKIPSKGQQHPQQEPAEYQLSPARPTDPEFSLPLLPGSNAFIIPHH